MNNFKEGLNKGGRPRIYKTPKQMEKKIVEYFDSLEGEIDEEGKVLSFPSTPTITGLALYLGFCDKGTLYNYGERDGFSTLVKRARTCIEQGYEQALMGKASTGAIFALKCNYNWQDKQVIEQTNRNIEIEI